MDNQETEILQALRDVSSKLQDVWNEIGFDQESVKQRWADFTDVVKVMNRSYGH